MCYYNELQYLICMIWSAWNKNVSRMIDNDNDFKNMGEISIAQFKLHVISVTVNDPKYLNLYVYIVSLSCESQHVRFIAPGWTVRIHQRLRSLLGPWVTCVGPPYDCCHCWVRGLLEWVILTTVVTVGSVGHLNGSSLRLRSLRGPWVTWVGPPHDCGHYWVRGSLEWVLLTTAVTAASVSHLSGSSSRYHRQVIHSRVMRPPQSAGWSRQLILQGQ